MNLYRIVFPCCVWITFLSQVVSHCFAQGMEKADLLLKNGTIYDGSGAAPWVGDLVVRNGKIVAVAANQNVQADQAIDCTGLAIAPGFIDLHNHSDSPILEKHTRANVAYLMQGCTTIVTGNCGGGSIRVAEYLDKIDNRGAGTNVLHLLPHGDLREAVLGKSARDPNEEELEKMRQLAHKAMTDGAWGMTTGLIYVPGTYSKTEELIEIAKVVAQHHGIYASHIRGEGTQLLDSVKEALQIGREAKLPVHISHFKASGKNVWGSLHVAAELIEEARRSGQNVTADQYPYSASSTSLEATLLPSWCREGGRSEIKRRLNDANERARIRSEVIKKLSSSSRIQIAGYDPRREWIGKSLDEIAALDGREMVDVVLEMESHGGARVINFGMSEEDVRMAMQQPWVATASDGGAKIPTADQPHPRSFGTFARKIGYYASQQKVVTLEQAVRSSSGLPAEIIGLTDRGFLKEGQVADIAVFDPIKFIDQATYDAPYRYASGVRYVYVNGVPAIFEGLPTGALAGKAIRK